jgi:general secretion pathway protein H
MEKTTRKAATVLPRISLATTKPCSATNSRGFTLIEIMVVLGIMGAVLAVGVPKLFDNKSKMKSEVRRISVLTHEIRNSARLNSSTFRLVISIPEEGAGKEPSFWVESAPGNVTIMTDEQKQDKERAATGLSEEAKKKTVFALDSRILKKPETLPRGLFFEDVEYPDPSPTTTTGTAYIHFFPQGLVQEALIHLTDKKTLHWTIAVQPLTGRATIFEKHLSMKEYKQ